jgi:hypothetical protein
VRITVSTLCDSMTSIHQFAGTDATAAVVEPEAKAILKGFDTRVEHCVVLLDARA